MGHEPFAIVKSWCHFIMLQLPYIIRNNNIINNKSSLCFLSPRTGSCLGGCVCLSTANVLLWTIQHC